MIDQAKLISLLSKPEHEYTIDLTIRLLKDVESFEFSDTDKYALKEIMTKISACLIMEEE